MAFFPHLETSDLRDPKRLLAIWREHGNGVNEVDFMALAVRARRKAKANPCGLFRHLVLNRKTGHISIQDEDEGRKMLRHALGDFRRERELRLRREREKFGLPEPAPQQPKSIAETLSALRF